MNRASGTITFLLKKTRTCSRKPRTWDRSSFRQTPTAEFSSTTPSARDKMRGGPGVPPVNHAQDARAITKLSVSPRTADDAKSNQRFYHDGSDAGRESARHRLLTPLSRCFGHCRAALAGESHHRRLLAFAKFTAAEYQDRQRRHRCGAARAATLGRGGQHSVSQIGRAHV